MLWFLSDDSRLSDRAKDVLGAPTNAALVSSASIWEITIKRSLGKLRVPEDFVEVVAAEGFDFVSISPAHAWATSRLPLGDHKDPFDRLLTAQALVEGVPLISADTRFDSFGVERLW